MIGDGTTIRAESRGAARDVDTDTLRAYFLGGAYDEATVWRFVAELWRVCTTTQLRISVVAGQIANETNRFRFGGAVGPEQFNLAGIGSTDDGAAGRRFASIEEGVRAVAAHHGGYLFGPAERWPAPWRELLPLAVRLPVVLRAGYGGTVATLGNYGAGRWATDKDYAAKVARHANALLAMEAPSMALSFRQAIIPKGQPNRPGTKLEGGKPKGLTWHTTGNTRVGANAQAHVNFTHRDKGGPERVSFHDVVDEDEAVQLLPYDEEGHHAGDGLGPGSGGSTTLGIELCVNSDGDWERTLRNGAVLGARHMRDFGLGMDAHHQHNDWSGKDCPRELRKPGEWRRFLGMIAAEYARLVGVPSLPEGFIRAGQPDSFVWPDGEGIITYRKSRWFNPATKVWYEREWDHQSGYGPWVIVG